MLESLSPTKQDAAARADTVYHYYAGYPQQFVVSLLDQIDVGSKQVVLDPWNGAGTTTEVCAFRGIDSVGIDINPFMRTVAEVRSMFPSDVLAAVDKIRASLGGVAKETGPAHRIAAHLLREAELSERIERDDPVARFVFASATRSVLRAVKTKNPTWFSVRLAEQQRFDAEAVTNAIFNELDRLAAWAHARDLPAYGHKLPILLTGDARTTWLGRRVDHIVGSPPYLTRIDYAKKTLPELLFLNELYHLDINALRTSMLGTVLTDHAKARLATGISDTARKALRKIERHSSKASSTYYARFFGGYFNGLWETLTHVLSHLAEGGTVTLVTQGSYYKEIYVDLPQIVREMMAAQGFVEHSLKTFRAKSHMALINSRTYASKQAAPDEVVSIFRAG